MTKRYDAKKSWAKAFWQKPQGVYHAGRNHNVELLIENLRAKIWRNAQKIKQAS